MTTYIAHPTKLQLVPQPTQKYFKNQNQFGNSNLKIYFLEFIMFFIVYSVVGIDVLQISFYFYFFCDEFMCHSLYTL